MDPVAVFLQRALTPQAWFILPLSFAYLITFLAHGASGFGIVLAIAAGVTGWFCDKQTFEVVPQALEDEDSANLAWGASIAVNVGIGFLVLVDTQRPSPSFAMFVLALGLKLIVPAAFCFLTYETFLTVVFPTLETELSQDDTTKKAVNLAQAQQVWKEQDRQEQLKKEQARVKAVENAQALVLGFYTQHRSLLKSVVTDAMILTKVQAAIQTKATLEQANAAANTLLTELHQHLKSAQAKAAEAEERDRQRRQKVADIDAQIAKLKDRLANVPNSPLFSDDDEAQAAEISGIERQIAKLDQDKTRILTAP